jgi:hypothetical protein
MVASGLQDRAGEYYGAIELHIFLIIIRIIFYA